MGMREGLPRFVDNGTAPEFFINELREVRRFGSVVRFVPVAYRTLRDGNIAEPPCTLVMPIEGVMPAINLTMRELASGLVVPIVETVKRGLMRLH